jgi:hypothetical protein
MDTTLARRGADSGWDEDANAGLEESPHALFGPEIPYVVKSPWFYLVVDEVIAKARNRIDGLIVPIRDLSTAARSRVSMERAAMHRQGPWLDQLDKPWDVWGTTPGGVVYSINEVDQARILAVGFHILVERFVTADLPITFVHFPRLALDRDYLFDKLRQFLPAGVTAEQSNSAFAEVVDFDKIHEFDQSGSRLPRRRAWFSGLKQR